MANHQHHHVFILRLHIISDMIFDDGTWWWTIDLAQRRKEDRNIERAGAGAAYHLLCGPLRADWLRDRPGGYRMTTSQKPDRLRLDSFSFLLATVAKGLRRRRRRRRYNHTAPITDDTTMFPFFPPLFQRLSIHVTFPFSFFLVFSIFFWKRICSQVVVLELLVPNDELWIGWHGAFVSVLIYKEESRQRKGTEEREKKLLPDQTLCCCSFFFAFLIFPLTWWCLPLHPLCHCLGCVFMYLLPMSQGSIYCSFYLSRCEKAEWNNNNKKEEEMFIKLIKTGIVFYL